MICLDFVCLTSFYFIFILRLVFFFVCIIFCSFYYSTNSDLTHLWEVVDVAKERLVNSTSTCSSPGDTSGGYGGQASTGRKTQRVVKASSTAPVITHTERPRSAHNEAEKAKEGSGAAFLGIEDAFDKAISLPNSPVTKEQPLHNDLEIKKTHETKKAQRRHHTHHLFDGILHTISGGERTEETKQKAPDQLHDNLRISENSKSSNNSPQDLDRSRWQQNKTLDASDTSASPSGTPIGLIRRWSETTTQNKQLKVSKIKNCKRIFIVKIE